MLNSKSASNSRPASLGSQPRSYEEWQGSVHRKEYCDDLLNALDNQVAELEKTVSECNAQPRYSPPGIIWSSKTRKNKYSYFVKNTAQQSDKSRDSRIYLSKDNSKIITALAEKKYLTLLKNKAEKELKLLTQFRQNFVQPPLSDIFDSLLPQYRNLVLPKYVSDDDYAKLWLSLPFTPLDREDSKADLTTLNHETVRSKSELIIANLLHDRRASYKYECPLVLNDYGKFHQTVTYYPDFTVLNKRTRKIYYWEHLGMMDDPEYVRKNMIKLETYLLNGIYPGIDLIITWESSSHPLSTKVVEKIINEYLT